MRNAGPFEERCIINLEERRRNRAGVTCGDAAHQRVTLDSTIEIRDLRSDELEEYTLVAPDEANILENRISSLTPIGRAVYGRRAGEVIEFEAPAGTIHIRIENVRCPCWIANDKRA